MNKRGAPAAPPDSVDFLPRVPKGPVRPERRGNEDAEEKRERMEDPVAAGEPPPLAQVRAGVDREERGAVGGGARVRAPLTASSAFLSALGGCCSGNLAVSEIFTCPVARERSYASNVCIPPENPTASKFSCAAAQKAQGRSLLCPAA